MSKACHYARELSRTEQDTFRVYLHHGEFEIIGDDERTPPRSGTVVAVYQFGQNAWASEAEVAL